MATPPRTLKDYLTGAPSQGRPGPTIEAWKKRIPAIGDTRELGLPQPRQAMTDEELASAILDASTPMGVMGSLRKVGESAASSLGREIFERSKLIGRPIDFLKEKTALGKRLRAEAETPLPPAMRNKEIIEGEHSSGKLFDRPRVDQEVAGTGAGDFWQGPGFYKSTSTGPSGSVSSAYRESTAFVPMFVEMPSGTILDRDAVSRLSRRLAKEDPRNQTLTSLLEKSDLYFDDADELAKQIRQTRVRLTRKYKDMTRAGGSDKAAAREAYRDEVALLGDLQKRVDISGTPRVERFVPQDLRQATYAAQFAANPDELFDLQRAITDQPSSERLMAALNEFNHPYIPNQSLADVTGRMSREAGMTPFDINERLVGNKYQGASDAFAGLDRFQLMNRLREKGIVGNKYLTKYSAENPNLLQTHNYVAQDPSRVRLTDVWAAAPLGLALRQAEQKRPAADSTTRTTKRRYE